jgi:alkylmercury lyase
MTLIRQSMGDLFAEGGPLDLGPDRSRFFVRLIREVARGQPVPQDQVAGLIADLELAPGEAREFLEQWTERDRNGDVVGLVITLNETPHRYTMDGRQLFAWCAMDTLVLPTLFDRAGHVESVSPTSGETSTLDVTPEGLKTVSPRETVLSFPVVEPDEIDTSSVPAIWGTFCHRTYFFASRNEAERWVRDKDKIGIASLDEGFDYARGLGERLRAYDP